MGDLRRNFDAAEFVCRCRRHAGEPPILPAVAALDALQELRDLLDRPLVVISAIRCEEHNREVGGAADSRHLPQHADAFDVYAPSTHGKPCLPVLELYKTALLVGRFRLGGIGIYPDRFFVHVDTRPGPARWGQLGRDPGRREYVEFERALNYAVGLESPDDETEEGDRDHED